MNSDPTSKWSLWPFPITMACAKPSAEIMNAAPIPAATIARSSHVPNHPSIRCANASTAASHPSDAPAVNGATANAHTIEAASHAPMIMAWYFAFSTCAAVSRTPRESCSAASMNAAIPDSWKTRSIIASWA
ncbi:hypothetical protein [Kitasatospora herbaricolor]|uniref:hypothetical protein n=1 Tax=Kitasatospora herbaricolor TaxID=68217 RepID=UPI0036D810B3